MPRSPASSQAPALAVICSAIFLDALDLSITQVALPKIQSALDLSADVVPWLATAYVITYGSLLLLGGRLADVRGSRGVFLTGVAVFGLASGVAGIAGDATTIVAARAGQGVGAALTVPAAVALLAATFPEGPARNRAFATFAAAASSGFAFGLVVGGLLTEGLSWRWIFLIKLPLVVAMLIIGARALPRTPSEIRRSSAVGRAFVGTLAIVLFTYGLSRVGYDGALDVATPVLAALIAFGAFVGLERRTDQPVLPPHVLRNRPATASSLAALTVLAAPFSVAYLTTTYLQAVEGHDAWATAGALLPGAVTSAVVGHQVAGRALDRYGLRAVYLLALLVVAVGNAMLLALGGDDVLLVGAAAFVSLGLGMGLAYPAATVGGVAGVPAADQGVAAAVNNTALQIGGGVGLAAVAAAMSVALGGAPLDAVDHAAAVGALRAGVVVSVVLPVLGAAVVAVGLSPSRAHIAS